MIEDSKEEEKYREGNRSIIDRHVSLVSEDFQTYVAQTSDHSLQFPVSRADSVYLWDAYGNSFLDFTSGIGVNNIGNRNWNVMNAIKEQLDHYSHTMVYGEHLQKTQIEYAKAISSKFPPVEDHPQQVFFVNSGNEAVDLALKMVRKLTGRKPMIALKNGFHGRGYGAMSVSWRKQYKDGFFVDDTQHSFLRPNEGFESYEKWWDSYAGIILELVQGEAGCIPLDPEWVKGVTQKVRSHGGVVIVDEIQTGYGRTGTFLAQEQYGIDADITCLGKAGGGGLPFGAVVSSRSNFERLQSPALSHLSTFGGNPVVMSAGLATIEYIQEELLEHVKEVGKYLTEQVKELAETHPDIVVGSRGLGLMQGLMLNPDYMGPEITELFFRQCLMRGLLLHFKLNAGYTLRMSPPLIISERTVKEAVDIMHEVCREIKYDR